MTVYVNGSENTAKYFSPIVDSRKCLFCKLLYSCKNHKNQTIAFFYLLSSKSMFSSYSTESANFKQFKFFNSVLNESLNKSKIISWTTKKSHQIKFTRIHVTCSATWQSLAHIWILLVNVSISSSKTRNTTIISWSVS